LSVEGDAERQGTDRRRDYDRYSQAPDDIYNTIIRERYFETVIQHKAEVAGKPFYSFFTMKDLDTLKKTLGNYDYSLEMMNDPLPESERLFRSPFPVYHELPAQDYKTYIAADFAYSRRNGLISLVSP